MDGLEQAYCPVDLNRTIADSALYSEKLLWTRFAIGIVIVAFLYGFLQVMEYMTMEKVMPYTVAGPKSPENGEVLEKLSIKVCRSQLKPLNDG